MALQDELYDLFPWLRELGLTPRWVQDTVATSASTTEIVQKIRNTPQYKQRFPGITRADGTATMNEAQYIQQETSYRRLLRQYGYDVDRDYASPSSLVGFFQNEIAPDELSDRLLVYRQVQEGGQQVKDAFYVYAGLNVSDDDLFEAIVDPAAAQNLVNEFNQARATQPVDYPTFIARATNLGLQRVAETLQDMERRGALTGEAVQRLISVDPAFAQEVVSAIYGAQGGDVNTGRLSLHELLDAFEFAAVGSAARRAGLELPTRERLAEIRAAGVDRQKQIAGYAEFGRNAAQINAAVLRARGQKFGQTEFEAAQFLGEANAGKLMDAGLGYMKAAGMQSGTFRFNEDRAGRIQQTGLRAA